MPNLTPMLDIVFIMLIFFIVTSTFVTERGIDVTPPEPTMAPPDGNPKDILVRIHGNDQLTVQGKLSDPRALRAHLMRLSAEQSEAAVAIDASPGATNGTLVLVMDTARSIGAPIRLVNRELNGT